MRAIGLFTVLLLPIWAHAATIWHESASASSPAVNVVLEGRIVTGDYEKLLEVLKEQGPRVERLFLFSPGGNLGEALRIAEMVKKL